MRILEDKVAVALLSGLLALTPAVALAAGGGSESSPQVWAGVAAIRLVKHLLGLGQ